MNRADAEQYLKGHHQAVLATTRKDGRPQLSNVLVVYRDGKLHASITETRAKYHNMKRDPRVAVDVLGDTFWEYLVVDGRASFIHWPEARTPLREYYEAATGGPHPNWEEYDQAMERERRLLLTITVEDMYPLSGS